MTDAYTQLSDAQLLDDPALQAYALEGAQAEAWQAWLAAHPAQAPRIEAAVAALQHVRAAVAPEAEASPARKQALWERIAASTAAPQSARVVELSSRPSRAKRLRRWAVAAAAAAVLGIALLLGWQEQSYHTHSHQQQKITLADGSTVILAPHSSLEVISYGDQRQLTLAGEAWFEVAKGTPFVVTTAAGQVAVLGTSFNVASADDRLDVACATGRVQVSVGEAKTILNPGEGVRSTAEGEAATYSIAPTRIATWRRGQLVLEQAPLSQVATSIERHYDRPVHVAEKYADRRLTVDLPTDNLAVAVARLEFLLQTDIDTTNSMIRIQ